MNQEQWAYIEAHFDRLRELAPDQRAGALAAIDDSDVRRELEILIQNSTDSTTLASVFGAMAVRVDGIVIGEHRIGPYRLSRRLGTGGMGAVYEAMRVDGFQKKVALKVIRQELDSEYSRERFLQERQVLATLEHPRIARLLDGGETEGGSPYLVLEFVEGQPIDRYISQPDRPVDRNSRLDLFLKVCEAVEYAHRSLVVHRDLKPQNILVTPDGEPKLLDFGIAKLIDGSGSRTQTGFQAMTPNYASPEQVRGLPVTTSSDVYSLGVVLYEMLTERRPYTIETGAPQEIDRVVCEQLPAPSGLGDELDDILSMALRKEPERRYGSVREFGEDIERYRRHERVLARPDTSWYRARKYLRRNWGKVLTASVAISGILAGSGLALYEAQVAEERFQQVRQLSHRFIFDFNDRLRVLPGSTEVREMMVATALEYLDNLSRHTQGDASLEWELAKAYEKVGDVQGSPTEPSLGHAADALKSYKKSIAMQEDLARRNRLTPEQHGSLAHSYAQMAAVYRGIGEPSQAVEAAGAGLSHAKQASDVAEAAARTHLGLAQLLAGDPSAALATSEPAEAALKRSAAQEAGWGPAHASLSSLYSSIGRAEVRLARFDAAVENFTRSVSLRESHLTQPALDTVNARDLVLTYHAIGDALGGSSRYSMGKFREAAVWYRKALALAERLEAADAKNASARFEVVRSQGKLGAALESFEPAESLRLFKHALDAAEQLLPAGEMRDGLRAAAYRSMAGPLSTLGHKEEARQKLQLCFNIDEAAMKRRPHLAAGLADLSEDWLKRGDLEWPFRKADAIASWQTALGFADRYAEMTPKDFFASYLQDEALSRLSDRLEPSRPEAQLFRQKRLALWTKWNAQLPGSTFIQQRLRQVMSTSGAPAAQ